MRIQHNILAMNAYRNYTNNTSALSKNLEKLSSGYKINRAGDDAAGLAISEKMRAQITGLGAAQKNVKDGISLVKTAEGALSEVHDMLNRMVYLATQSANGTYDGTDRVQLQKELDQLRTEINRISEASNFNGIKLLDGSMDASGGIKNVSSLSRMLNQVGTGAGNVGRVTILDSDPRIKSGNTEFDIDFTALTTSKAAGAGGGGGGPQKTDAGQTITVASFTNTSVKFTYELSIGDAQDVTVKLGNTYFKITNMDKLATAAVAGGSGSKENPYEINAQGKTMQDVYQAIVDKVKGTPGAASATIAIDGHNFKISASANGITFVATAASTVFNAYNGKEEDFMKMLDEELSVTTDKYADPSTAVVKPWGYARVTMGSVGGAKGSATINISPGTLKLGATITIGTLSIKVTASMVPDGANVTASVAIRNLKAAITTALNNKATTASCKLTMGTITAADGSLKLKITLTEATAGKFVDPQGFEDLFKYDDPDVASVANDVSAVPAAANNGISVAATSGGGGGKISFGVKLAGQTLVDAIQVAEKATAATITKAVWEALKGKYTAGSDGGLKIKLNINGAEYSVTYASGGTKLHFKLLDDPTKENINGNFDWNITGETEKFGDNHDGGTIVTTAGRAVVANQAANTIFRIEQGDIKDGATITLKDHDGNTKTVTIHVGQDGQDNDATENGAGGNVYLTADEAKNLGTVLSRISKSFGSRVGDLIIGVNDKSNGDGHMGLAIKHVNTHSSDTNSDNVYLTKEDFAKVFDLKVPRNPEGTGLTLQIGDTADSYNQLAVSIAACDSAALGLDGVDISTQVGAANAVEAIKNAINYVSDVRGTLGATQNRLEHTANNLSVMAENIQDAESTIRDTDVAEEMMSYVKNNILIQSAQAMLAQANQIPQGVLQLLG